MTAPTVQQSIDLVKWVTSLDDEARLRLLVFLCGYRPELLEMLRLEQEEDAS